MLVIVARPHRGQGVMRQMLQTVMAWCDTHLAGQAQHLYLWTEDVDQAYQRIAGFEFVRNIVAFGRPAKLMRRPLPSRRS